VLVQFIYISAHQAWYAAANGLYGGFERFKADNRVPPRANKYAAVQWQRAHVPVLALRWLKCVQRWLLAGRRRLPAVGAADE